MKLNEFDLIKNIQTHLVSTNHNLLQGIGDDCAVINKDEQTAFVISTDALIEDVHFDLKNYSYVELGKKAMAVNLSDIAAMGAKPLYAFITLGIPSKCVADNISDLYIGLEQVAQEFSVAIAGGDLSRSSHHLFLSLTVVGEVAKNGCKLRSGAQAGDGIYVSGLLGSAAIGLSGLNKKRKLETHYLNAIKNPRPKIPLANILSECPYVHSLIDISDGLVQDLGHVMQASHRIAKIELDKIPCEPDFYDTCKKFRLNGHETLLTGGEDYQLLFTMNDDELGDLLKKLEMKPNIKITRIGSVLQDVSNKDQNTQCVLILDEQGKEIKLGKTGFEHFSS
ncbi:MAG: hypothetical protein ACD_62C00363G0014 [uncultured bacterium]|nr:MAG: hypothetical protein ACD_62C00363G0014 [uncultured bacterium]HLD43999.1 thiamine-phosphate kinase [bacterium]